MIPSPLYSSFVLDYPPSHLKPLIILLVEGRFWIMICCVGYCLLLKTTPMFLVVFRL